MDLLLFPTCVAEYVFALDASDDFLTRRVQGLPENVAEKMRYTQDEFVPRLTKHRQLSGAEETVCDYFDQIEVHPLHIGTVCKATTTLHSDRLITNKRQRVLKST